MLVSQPLPCPPSAAAVVVVPELLIHRPSSWFEPLDPGVLFGRTAPLELELGSGDGSFLVEWARQHPERDFVGVERLLGRIRKLDKKAQRAGLQNLRGLRIEAGYCVEYLFPAGSVDVVHVYFPDPWPKRRHHKNRLVNERFTGLCRRILRPGGCVCLRTDDAEYFAQMRTVFGADSAFVEVATPEGLTAVTTDFERAFNARGIPTLRAGYALKA